MYDFSGIIGFLSPGKTSITIFIDIMLKGILLSILAYMLGYFVKRFSAAVRHFYLSITFIALLIMPVISVLMPSWHVPILKETTIIPAEIVPGNSPAYLNPEQGNLRINPTIIDRSGESPNIINGSSDNPITDLLILEKKTFYSSAAIWISSKWIIFALFFWLSGVLFFMTKFLYNTIIFHNIIRNENHVRSGACFDLIQKLKKALNLSKNIRLIQSSKLNTPMTWGFFNPVILTPSAAEKWPKERQGAVLLHEMAHIKRYDILYHYIALFVKTIYWYNPAVWYFSNRLNLERERACDDHVLHSGLKSREYARHLLEIAATLHRNNAKPAIALGITRKSNLESRLLSILNPDLNRKTLRPKVVSVVCAAALLLVAPIASLQPWDSTPAGINAEYVDSNEVFELKTEETYERLMSESSNKFDNNPNKEYGNISQSESLKAVINALNTFYTTKKEIENASDKKFKTDPGFIQNIVTALSDGDSEVRLQAVRTIGSLRIIGCTDAIIEILNDDNENIRISAVKTLRLLNTSESLNATIKALNDQNPKVRVEAVKTLMVIDEPDAKEVLAGMLNDDDPVIRLYAILAFRPGIVNEQNPEIIKTLYSFLESSDKIIRLAALTSLIKTGDNPVFASLEKELDTEDSQYGKAVMVLTVMKGSDQDINSIFGLISDKTKSLKLRTGAIHALTRFNIPDVRAAINGYTTDESPVIRAAALSGLTIIGDHESIKYIRTALRDNDPAVREAAAYTLGCLKDMNSVNLLLSALKDKNNIVRQNAAWALGNIGDYSAKEALLNALKDNDPKVRSYATQALGKLNFTDSESNSENNSDKDRN